MGDEHEQFNHFFLFNTVLLINLAKIWITATSTPSLPRPLRRRARAPSPASQRGHHVIGSAHSRGPPQLCPEQPGVRRVSQVATVPPAPPPPGPVRP